jgi:hypothetical protein
VLKQYRVTVLVSSIYKDHFKRTMVPVRAKSRVLAIREVKAKAELFGPCYVIGAELAPW